MKTQITVERINTVTFKVNGKLVKKYGHIIECDTELSIVEHAALIKHVNAAQQRLIKSSVFAL